jgi:putative methyltransferase (TIGR04325 family)
MAYNGPIWEGVNRNFTEVTIVGQGFDGETWIGNSLKKIIKMSEEVAGEGVLLPPASNYRECLLPLIAAMNYNDYGTVRILDFGGGIGFTYYQTIHALTHTEGIEYHIVERESVCEAGKKFFRTKKPKPIFLTKLPVTPDKYDIIHLGSSIHYVEEWKQLLAKLCELSLKYLLLVDVPAGNIPTFATAQYYYGSRVPVWFFDIEEILHTVRSFGYEMTYKSVLQPTILGTEQELPMQNFENKYRLKQACNLLFKRLSND